jgi:hypothetical protein
MPNLNPNSTNYVHTHEPNTNDLVQAMDYDPYGRPVLRIDDTTKQHTSKNRVKVSDFEIIGFNSYQYTLDTDIWDQAVTGTASSAIDVYRGMAELTVGGSVGDEVIRQTRRVQRYIPGRQSEVSMSVIFGASETGIRRRFGLFDATNGAYFEDGGDGTYYAVCRHTTASGLVEERVARENWNVDRLDGTGPSGITADATKIQLMVIEYEWYGAGQVEFKFIINNNAYPVHRFDHANLTDQPWSNPPFLPIRAELTNVAGTAGTHKFYTGSYSSLSEGNVGPLGVESSASTLITGKSIGNQANTFIPMVSIRLKADRMAGVVIPIDFQAATLDNTAIFYRLVLNPVLTGADWVSVDPESFVEYDISATAQTNGKILKTGFISTNNQGDIIRLNDPKVLQQLGRSSMGTVSDILSVEIACIQSNKSGFASLNWIEVR